MIQFNLLPDVKIEYIKARRIRQLVTSLSFLVAVISVAVLLLSILSVDVVQKKSLSDLDRDITANNTKLTAIPNLDNILTVQNQLNTLTGLHDQKVVGSRLFGYMAQLIPNGVTVSTLNVDYTQNTIAITGSAPSLDLVNKFTDTLKTTTYATYTTDTAGQQQQASDDAYYASQKSYPSSDGSNGTAKALTNVVLSSFSKDDKQASYTINASIDPLIFSNANNVELRVPNSTVSNTSILFKQGEN